MFVEVIEKSFEEIDKGLDQVFRLRSRFNRWENTPRDIMVSVLSKKLKDEILRQSYQNPIEYKDRRVMILMELPKQVIMQRKYSKSLQIN